MDLGLKGKSVIVSGGTHENYGLTKDEIIECIQTKIF